MYNIHYNYFSTKYVDDAGLLFTDTDSFAYEIKTEDFYKDISYDVEKLFDTSDYTSNRPTVIKIGVNSKMLEKFMDELVVSRLLNLWS